MKNKNNPSIELIEYQDSKSDLYTIGGLICCWPFGLYFMWKSNWSQAAKIIITFFIILLSFVSLTIQSEGIKEIQKYEDKTTY